MSEVFILAIVIVMSVTALASAIISALSLRQTQKTYFLINENIDRLLKLAADRAHDAGVIEGTKAGVIEGTRLEKERAEAESRTATNFIGR